MRIPDALRLLVGLLFLATLPTGSAQRNRGACITDADCGPKNCCTAALTCSKRRTGTIGAGRRADDVCECASQKYDAATKRCGCNANADCRGGKCCTANDKCSVRTLASVLPGRPAADACECLSGSRNAATATCSCVNNSDCQGGRCCTAGSCSRMPAGSVQSGRQAGFSCECASGFLDPSTKRCSCSTDGDCPGKRCCGENGQCSNADRGSAYTGEVSKDKCECTSGVLDSLTGMCGCSINRHCGTEKCCMADNRCSNAPKNSIAAGAGPAADECECVSGKYNAATQLCACATNRDCAGSSCCKADGTCSAQGSASILPGGIASDACECSSKRFNAATRQCTCSNDRHCPGDLCCGAGGICSTVAKGSVPSGSAAADACECTQRNRYSPPTTPGGAGFCGCFDDSQCAGNRCCTDNGRCSIKNTASVPVNGRASHVCECASSAYNAALGRCVCGADSHCPDGKCCGPDGKCSRLPRASVAAGGNASNACECLTQIFIPSTGKSNRGKCGCDDDAQCPGNACCRADGRCSAKPQSSVPSGDPASDQCECVGDYYDADSGTCGCTDDIDCPLPNEICIPTTNICDRDTTIKGDPHMTGFLGQKFDFTGTDGTWYALVSEPGSSQLNMRVTVPVRSLPMITYMTGFSLLATDHDGHEHSIVITVKEPHNLASSCPVGTSRCLAQGALSVLLDGNEALVAPGTASFAPGIEITAVNTPGECRSFGFETYWARKKQEYAMLEAAAQPQQDNRKLGVKLTMGEWILANPTATNMAECTEYVARSERAVGGLFNHQSEHTSFRIDTPAMKIRLSHGKLHQLAMRDPTDTIDLPEHVTWQMNVVIDHADVTSDARGIIGETVIPTRDTEGNMITRGIDCIRGTTPTDYAVDGPLGTAFPMDISHTALQDGPPDAAFPTDTIPAVLYVAAGTLP